MPHRCNQCDRKFRKSAFLRQHERTSHIEGKPKRRSGLNSHFAGPFGGFASQRQMMIARNFAGLDPGFMPFGGAFGIGEAMHGIGSLAQAAFDRALAPHEIGPPTLDLKANDD